MLLILQFWIKHPVLKCLGKAQSRWNAAYQCFMHYFVEWLKDKVFKIVYGIVRYIGCEFCTDELVTMVCTYVCMHNTPMYVQSAFLFALS